MPLSRYHNECFVCIQRQKAPLIYAAFFFFFSHQRQLELSQELREVSSLLQPKYKTSMAFRALCWESLPAAERGPAQCFTPSPSLTENRWLSGELLSCESQSSPHSSGHTTGELV